MNWLKVILAFFKLNIYKMILILFSVLFALYMYFQFKEEVIKTGHNIIDENGEEIITK